MTTANMNDIWSALRLAEQLAERNLWNATGRNYADAKNDSYCAKRGMEAYTALSRDLPRMRDLLKASEREYDRYVERDRESCSCHLSAPCSYCTRQCDEDEDANAGDA
jgi:hypothetical protein